VHRALRDVRWRDEVLGGLTITAVAVPLGLGYGEVAELPPETGLYAALWPVVAYALVGASRRIVIGPDAGLAAILAGSSLVHAEDAADALRLASLTALVAAAILVAIGLLRLGSLAELVSRPVLVGYLAAVALVVAVGQAPALLGFETDADGFPAEVAALARSLDETEAAAAAVGAAALAGFLLLRRLVPRAPAALVVAVAGALAVWAGGLEDHGVALIGDVPEGLPDLELPTVGAADLADVLPGAVGVALLAFVDTSLMGRAFAARAGDRADPNRDALGLGAAHAAAGLTGGLPVSASAARSAVIEASGVRSRAAALVSAAGMAAVLLFLTGAVERLPLAVVAGIVIALVLRLVDLRALAGLWRARRSELAVALAAVGVGLGASLLWGVLAAVGLSLLDLLRRAAAPSDRVSVRAGGVAVYRFQGALFFANASRFRRRVLDVARAERPRALVLDAAAIPDLDETAAEALRDVALELGRDGVRLLVAAPQEPVRARLALSADGPPAAADVHATVDEAVAAAARDGLGPAAT
jgi:MFS superfamily sulfate permease-like transporter